MGCLSRRFLHAAGAVVLLAGGALSQTTTRVSVGPGGAQGDGDSRYPSISADGRWLVFDSAATNLVSGDTNARIDVFLRDLGKGVTTRVSVDSSGAQGNGDSSMPSISSNGRYVVFESLATNLVSGDTNGWSDIFVHDRLTGATTRVSVNSSGAQASSLSLAASISSEGHIVAFESYAGNLVSGDTNHSVDVFVHDLLTGTTTRASVDSAGAQGDNLSTEASISPDGRCVAFVSFATNLVSGDTNGWGDAFVHDLETGATTRVSVDSGGTQADSGSSFPTLSSDGRFVTFSSPASNLVPGDTNGQYDVFVHDRLTGATVRASVDPSGAQANHGSSNSPSTLDGRYVGLLSLATNLVPGDTNGFQDDILCDLVTGRTTLVSVDSGGVQGNNQSSSLSMSADGRFVAFYSLASNLVPEDTNGRSDIFLRDRGAASAFVPFCSGDGSGAACPCGNAGAAGRGCENSAGTGGAQLSASGVASHSADTVQLTSSGERATAFSIFLQGRAGIAPVHFGDGLRCAGEMLLRMYVKSAVGGVVTAPEAGDPSLLERSARAGDPVPLGWTRVYQVYYRDPSPSFCPSPAGATFNASNAIAIAWGR
jgi:Tol biopolymer transport system component